MKKIISALIICVLVVGCVCALTGCGGKTLNGTYVLEASFGDFSIGSETYEFSGNKVEVTKEIGGFEKTTEGTYEITTDEEGKMTLTITFEAEEGEDPVVEKYTFSEGTEDGVDYIKLNGGMYVKEAK